MPFRIAKTFTVESGHLLTKHPGACKFPHGHSRTVEVVLTADTLDARDMVCDFKALKNIIETAVTRYDHSLALNTADPQFATLRSTYGDRIVPFEQTDPTSEAMARVIFQEIRSALANAPGDPTYPIGSTVHLERVRLTETATSWAEYWE
ncbi:MAG TPA: 6-carboxytetrahydropterin synthase [Rariglobus sp.]|nr:6-carboxytetrahydropterin synthase [Rariglobus sp.]